MKRYLLKVDQWKTRLAPIRVKPTPPKFTGATCKGCFEFNSECGLCEKCKWYEKQRAEGVIVI